MAQARRRTGGRKPSKTSMARKASPQANLSAVAGDANAVLMAVSTMASADDAKKETIFACIVSNFFAQGLKHIQNQQAKVVWTTIDDPVIVALGDGITNCINAKGFDCTPLAPAFQNLKNMGQVTIVSDLINGIAILVQP